MCEYESAHDAALKAFWRKLSFSGPCLGRKIGKETPREGNPDNRATKYL